MKLLLNSVISTPNAKFMTLDIKNFYLNTPMERYEYMRLKLDQLPADVIEQYGLEDKVTSDGYVYVEVRKGMYGLPQAGLLAQQLLEKRLEKHGYTQSKQTPGLWKHKWRPICFFSSRIAIHSLRPCDLFGRSCLKRASAFSTYPGVERCTSLLS